MSKEEILTIKLHRLQAVINGVQTELEEIIKSQAPVAPEKPRKRRNLKQEGVDKYRARYGSVRKTA